jgi:alpha-L-fucosidase 2
MLQDLPPYATDSTGLLIAAGQPLDETHRHHAHLMAVYPLGLLNNTLQERSPLLQTSLRQLEKIGTRWWCGYSFSWAACIYARARESEKAVEQLRIFATNFCSTNSFHLNGDQRGGQYSNFTYRPFTLEGNFAFAQGVHELLLQTHNEVIEVFPAVPTQWATCSFHQLRAEGAVLVSARRSEGHTVSVTLTGTVDGMVLLQLPFEHYEVKGIAKAKLKVEQGVASISLRKGQTVQFIRK